MYKNIPKSLQIDILLIQWIYREKRETNAK
jgi:hypothetical protein